MAPVAWFQVTSPFWSVGTRWTRSATGCRLASNRTRPAYRRASTWAAGTSSLKSGEKLVGLSQSPTTRVPPSWRAGSGWYGEGSGLALPSEIPCTDGSVLQPTSSGTARARTATLDVIEDLAALPLKFALGDGSALAKLVQLTHIGDQVHERRGKPLAQIPIFLTVKLRRPGVPGFQIEERFEGRIRDPQRLDPILLDAQQPQGEPVAGVMQLPVEIALEDLAILEPNRHFSLCARPLLRAGFAGGQRNPLDRGKRDERALVVAGLIRHLYFDIRLIQADVGHPALHDLVVEKSDGDGGGFSGPRTAHLWPSWNWTTAAL